MSENFGSTTLAQVAIVVHNIEEASQRYADIFGLPVSEPIVTAPGLEGAVPPGHGGSPPGLDEGSPSGQEKKPPKEK